MIKVKNSKQSSADSYPELKEFIELLKEMNDLQRAQTKGYMQALPTQQRTA